MIKLTKTEIQFFNQNGYLIIKNYFSNNELDDFKTELIFTIKSYLDKINNRFEDKNEFKFIDEALIILENDNHENIAALYDTIFQMPSFFRICGKKNTQSIVNQIIGKNIDNPLYIFTNRCRIDPPQDNRRTYDWHQEVFYTIPESNFIQTWAPLIRKTTKINGTIEVCASSHNEGIANADWVERDDKALQVKVKDSVVKKYEQKVIPLELGDILFFSGRTIHRSGNNTSDHVRFSLVGMYHDINNKKFISPSIKFDFRSKNPSEYFVEKFSKY